MATDKQIEANRRNASRSTGPKTAEGKAHSRGNARKHGLAAKVLVLEDEVEEIREARDAWTSEDGPWDAARHDLAQSAAIASALVKRCAQAEDQALQQSARDAVRRWEKKRRHAVRRQAQNLIDDPVNTLEDLEGSSFGCEWLIRRWRALEAPLAMGHGWAGDDLIEALRLCGFIAMAPQAGGDPTARWLWSVAHIANPGPIARLADEAFDAEAPRDPAEAIAALRQFVAERIDRLEELREEAWQVIDGPECRAIASRGRIDLSRDGQLRHRYARDADLAMTRAVSLLMKLDDRSRKADAEAQRAASMRARGFVDPKRPRSGGASPSPRPERRNEPNRPAVRDRSPEPKLDVEKELRDLISELSASSPKRTEPVSGPIDGPPLAASAPLERPDLPISIVPEAATGTR